MQEPSVSNFMLPEAVKCLISVKIKILTHDTDSICS